MLDLEFSGGHFAEVTEDFGEGDVAEFQGNGSLFREIGGQLQDETGGDFVFGKFGGFNFQVVEHGVEGGFFEGDFRNDQAGELGRKNGFLVLLFGSNNGFEIILSSDIGRIGLENGEEFLFGTGGVAGEVGALGFGVKGGGAGLRVGEGRREQADQKTELGDLHEWRIVACQWVFKCC